MLVCLLAGELMLRLVLPQQLIVPNHDIWRPDDHIGWRHMANANSEINTGEGLVHFVTDASGYRIDYPPSTQSPSIAALKIITIGDSFLEATQVENEFTMASVLQQALSKKYDSHIQVVNSGTGGWDPNQYLLEAKTASESYAYDLAVVFLYIGNDVVGKRKTEFSPQVVSAGHDFCLPSSLTWSEIVDCLLYPVNDWLETSSQLFVFVKRRTKSLLARIGLAAAYFPGVFRKGAIDSPAWATTASICRDISVEFKKTNTPVFFVLLPTPYQIDTDQFLGYLSQFDMDPDSVDIDQPNRLITKAFHADSLIVLDPLEHFRGLARDGLDMYGKVDRHFNENGHQVVAYYILPEVERLLRGKLDSL